MHLFMLMLTSVFYLFIFNFEFICFNRCSAVSVLYALFFLSSFLPPFPVFVCFGGFPFKLSHYIDKRRRGEQESEI